MYYDLHMSFTHDLVEVQEQFCFGEEISTVEVYSLETLPVNITRNRPACHQASINLTLSFDNGTTVIGMSMHVIIVTDHGYVCIL